MVASVRRAITATTTGAASRGDPALKRMCATGPGECLLQPGSAQWQRGVEHIIGYLSDGRLRMPISAITPLAEAGRAHRLLESRQVSGKLLLSVG